MEIKTDKLIKQNSKLKMTSRMRSLIVELSLIGLLSIVFIISVYSSITNNYSRITNEIYLDVENMNALNQSLYQHQALVFEHIVASSAERKNALEAKTDELESQMRTLLSKFNESTNGSKYEVYYHNIYSGIVGYLKNVDIIFDFSRNGEVETAQYYMENVLEDFLNTVNENVQTMDDITKQDMRAAKEQMDSKADFLRLVSTVLLVVLIVFSVLAQIIGFRVSNLMVNFDAVTGIMNYSHFLENLEKLDKNGELTGRTIMAINIKGFQYINQRIGIENGDLVLREYARALKEKLGEAGFIARSNGDGFMVCESSEKRNELLEFFSNVEISFISANVDELLETNKTINVVIPARIGYYIVEENIPPIKAIENATMALKVTRNTEFSDTIRYDEAMLEQEISRTQIIHEFGNALENKDFLVYYQPKINLKEKRLCGAEALVRWFRNDTIIPPQQFIPVLEQEGNISELDFYVFEMVCKALKYWKEKGYDLVPVSVNFSKVNHSFRMAAKRIIDTIDRYQIDGKLIEIELTESEDYDDLEALSEFIETLRSANIGVSVDEFGIGYSSLWAIKDLDVNTIKLSKAFVNGIRDDGENSKEEVLIRNIVSMMRDMNKNVVCIGVETLMQADFIKDAGCFLAQGFLYDRPLQPEEFEDRLKRPNY